MMDLVALDQEEQELLASFEAGEWQSVSDASSEIERYQQYARATLKKDRRVNIRLSVSDLEAIQRRAAEEGLPYQTLMASVLHKYAAGRLVERTGNV
jgi:predicted DNA binding CopG/RHH family protein